MRQMLRGLACDRASSKHFLSSKTLFPSFNLINQALVWEASKRSPPPAHLTVHKMTHNSSPTGVNRSQSLREPTHCVHRHPPRSVTTWLVASGEDSANYLKITAIRRGQLGGEGVCVCDEALLV